MKKFSCKILLLIIILATNTFVQAGLQTSNLVVPVTYFVNHLQHQETIKYNLEKYKKTSIVGMSGIGKTQLIRAYINNNKDKYDLIWFVDCNLNIEHELLKLAKAINLKEGKQVMSESISNIEDKIKDYIQTQDKWLIIFDNQKVNTYPKIKSFIDFESNGHIIFASQDMKKLPNVIKIKELSKKDSLLLIDSLLDSNKTENSKLLLESLNGYPIAITQGAQIINNLKSINLEQYKNMLTEEIDKIAFNVELSIKELNKSSLELLKKIALINNQRFSKKFLALLSDQPSSLDDDIYQLKRFALIDDLNNDKMQIFEMHDIIAETIRSLSTNKENKKIIQEIIDNICLKNLPKGAFIRYIARTSPTTEDNFDILLRNAEKYNANLLKQLELRMEMFATSENNGDYKTSKKMIEWFEKELRNQSFVQSKMNNHEKAVYASYLNIIGGHTRNASSNPIEARKYFNKSLDVINTIDQSIVDQDQYMKFNIFYQLFKTHLFFKDYKLAEDFLHKAEEAYEKGIKNNAIDESEKCYLNFGQSLLMIEKGLYDKALIQIDEVINSINITMSGEVDTKKHQLYLERIYKIKVDILNHLKKYKDVIALVNDIFNRIKPFVSEDHQMLVNLKSQEAKAYFGLKNYKIALSKADEAIKMLIKDKNLSFEYAQTKTDIQLANALTIKADSLSALNSSEEALKLYEKAEAIHNNIYKGKLNLSKGLKYILFEATKTACKGSSKEDTFWYTHFYSSLKLIFGADIQEVKDITAICDIKK